MDNFSHIKLYSVYIGNSYKIYMLLKWLLALVLMLGLFLMLTEFLMIAIPIFFVFLVIVFLHITLNRVRKKERITCKLTEKQFIRENLDYETILELNLDELKSVTFILDSYIFDVPYSSPSLVANLNRIIIVKPNNEKLNLLFLTNSYNEMYTLKEKIKKTELIHPNVKYKIGY